MYVHMGNHACKGYRCTLKPLKPLAAKNNLSLLALCRLEQITFCQCTNFHVHEDVCSVQSCTQKLCTGAKTSAKMALCLTVYKIQVQTNPHCPMSAIVTFNSLFLKQYHVSWSNIGFLCPSYILRFERAPRFWFACGRVVLGPLIQYPGKKIIHRGLLQPHSLPQNITGVVLI